MYVVQGRCVEQKVPYERPRPVARTPVRTCPCPVPETRVPGAFSGLGTMGPMSAATPPTERRVSARIGAISESATLAVDAKAKALKAAGRPVIGFGAGEPDFPTPDYIVEAAVEACRNPKYHRYTPAGGLPELKAAIAAKTLRDSGYEVDASQILVTNGGKQAIYEAFAAILDPGDEVIVPAPYWTTYPESIRLAGGVPVEVVADETTGYRVSVEQLEAARTERTKVVLFVSPSNPTGAVYSRGRRRGDRPLGRRARPVGADRRDLRAPRLRRREVHLAAGDRARAARQVHRRQRRRQDVRDDRLARGLGHRPQGRRQGRDQPPVARHLQRLQRGPGRRAGRRLRRSDAVAEMRERLRPPPPDRSCGCSTRSTACSARSPRARSTRTRR